MRPPVQFVFTLSFVASFAVCSRKKKIHPTISAYLAYSGGVHIRQCPCWSGKETQGKKERCKHRDAHFCSPLIGTFQVVSRTVCSTGFTVSALSDRYVGASSTVC